MIRMATARNDEMLLYRAMTRTVGGREDGMSRSAEGNLQVQFAFPGASSAGTNPEQLLAAGWSACFQGALSLAASRRQMNVPRDTTIGAEVDLNFDSDSYFLSGRLFVDLPWIDRDTACALIEEAYLECPFSKAMRGNVDITINLVLATSRRSGGKPEPVKPVQNLFAGSKIEEMPS